jgi:hypothetical protein
MRIVPAICFAFATVVTTSMLSVSSSHALTYPTKSQNCASTGQLFAEGVGDCDHPKSAESNAGESGGSYGRSAWGEHARSFVHGERGVYSRSGERGGHSGLGGQGGRGRGNGGRGR